MSARSKKPMSARGVAVVVGISSSSCNYWMVQALEVAAKALLPCLAWESGHAWLAGRFAVSAVLAVLRALAAATAALVIPPRRAMVVTWRGRYSIPVDRSPSRYAGAPRRFPRALA